MPLHLSNSYLALGSAFSQKCLPSPVVEPELVLWNSALASSLNIDLTQCNNDELAEYFSGNRLFESSQPIVQVYAGHQFGHFNPQLGDGRAHLLGDITDQNNQRWDIQLKGSGASTFSRQGDGRCAFGPALREYIMSEAMHALGVPTTRCLAVVSTGQAVYREKALPGAIVTRVASSHIRVGTFQFFAARQDREALTSLTRYAIERHYSEISLEATLTTDNILAFFEAVLYKQVILITSWLKVGFIHGVMNTDNTAISGETIDYGPCAMMNDYHNGTVFSSIDKNARYAFGNQSKIMQWNMARLADCLLLIIDEEEEQALEKISPLLQQFANNLQYSYFEMMVSKLGLTELVEGDVELVNDLLAILQEKQLDYTQFFVTLTNNLTHEVVQEELSNKNEEQDEWALWLMRWYKRIDSDVDTAKHLMQKNNPLVIPRNKDVEAVLLSTQSTGDLTPLHHFLEVLQQPFTELSNTHNYQKAPHDGDRNYYTFCGT